MLKIASTLSLLIHRFLCNIFLWQRVLQPGPRSWRPWFIKVIFWPCKFIFIPGPYFLDTATSVETFSDQLVCLHHALEFLGKFVVWLGKEVAHFGVGLNLGFKVAFFIVQSRFLTSQVLVIFVGFLHLVLNVSFTALGSVKLNLSLFNSLSLSPDPVSQFLPPSIFTLHFPILINHLPLKLSNSFLSIPQYPLLLPQLLLYPPLLLLSLHTITHHILLLQLHSSSLAPFCPLRHPRSFSRAIPYPESQFSSICWAVVTFGPLSEPEVLCIPKRWVQLLYLWHLGLTWVLSSCHPVAWRLWPCLLVSHPCHLPNGGETKGQHSDHPIFSVYIRIIWNPVHVIINELKIFCFTFETAWLRELVFSSALELTFSSGL